jgi:type II secretory pathway component PulF
MVPLHRLHFFFRQLGTLLRAGINPADALDTLSKQSSGKLATVLKETRDHVMAGRPMSAGFQRYPEVFTPLMMSMIRVGEQTGTLDEQCRQISEYIERDIELRNLIRRETAMPKITVAASVLIILGANSVIGVLAPGESGLPAPIAVWTLAVLAGAAAFVFVRFVLPHPTVRRAFDGFLLSLPWFGNMILGFSMAKFGRAFGAMYRAGVPLPQAVELAADACGNEAVRARVRPAGRRLESGQGITETFAATGAFSPIVLDMTRTGETTGNLEEMLTKIAEFYEDEGRTQAQTAAKIFGVAVLLLVGVYVLSIVVTFYTGFYAGRTSV